jgi:hypothetical protein
MMTAKKFRRNFHAWAVHHDNKLSGEPGSHALWPKKMTDKLV